MAEIKLIFGDIKVNQSLALTVEKDNDDFIFSQTFKEVRNEKGQVSIGLNSSETALNYVDALKLDFSFFSNGDITATVSRNVVTLNYNNNFIDIKSVTGSTITNKTVTQSTGEFILKYWFEFTDVQNVLHRVEILQQNILEIPVQIYGTCSLEYSETNDTLEAIRGCGLKIDLQADSDLTFIDLYSEEERTFSVVYKRDNEILFNGWLSPEGIYESLVSDKWVISLDCIDGLGFLNNLSYVDSDGVFFVGKQSMLEIVSNCLKRTKTFQNIYVNIDIRYNGLAPYKETLSSTYLNVNRFVKDDGDTIMNCEEVLKTVLEIFAAVLISYKGKWIIYKPNTLASNQLIDFYVYNSNGLPFGIAFDTLNLKENLGSQIDGYYPHHVNGNQQKTIKSSIGAYRINYNHGLVKSFVFNKDLISESDTIIPEYEILNSEYLSFPNNRRGVLLETISNQIEPIPILRLTDTITLAKGSVIDFYVKYFAQSEYRRANFEVKLITEGQTYYLKGVRITSPRENLNKFYVAEWVTNQSYIDFIGAKEYYSTSADNSATIKTDPTPELGNITITVLTSTYLQNNILEGSFYLTGIDLKPFEVDNNIKGDAHTFERIINPSSKIEKNKEVFNADNPSDIYEGTIYKQDKTTPTETWSRKLEAENKPLLQIMGEERMKMYSKPLQVFSGDIFGFFNYLSVFSINGLDGLFMATKYNYNAVENITSLELTEVLNPDIYNDIEYLPVKEYKEVIEPTIKG